MNIKIDAKLLDLRPDRTLLNANFDGYKLSLNVPAAIIKRKLEAPVNWLVPNLKEYSLLHGQVFGFHNYLVGQSRATTTTSSTESVYFIDRAKRVRKFTLNDTELNEGVTVWQVPDDNKSKRLLNEINGKAAICYNMCLKLIANNNMAVVSDGRGFLYVLSTANDTTDKEWSVIFSDEIAIEYGECSNFIISDVVYKNKKSDGDGDEINLLLVGVHKGIIDDDKYSMLVHWIKWTNLENDTSSSWHQTVVRQVKSKGYIQYLALERPHCNALYLVSDSDDCQFTLNSENEVKKREEEEVILQSERICYKWTQDNKNKITVRMTLPDHIITSSSATAINVKCDIDSVTVQAHNTIILSGNLYGEIEPELTTWTLTNDDHEHKFVLLLYKKNQHSLVAAAATMCYLKWLEFIVVDGGGDEFGKYEAGECDTEEAHKTMKHLCSDNENFPLRGTTFNSELVEDCDFESDKLSSFKRLCCKTNQVTHRIHLGTHQVLLTTALNHNLALALGVRSDVDICLYQPEYNADDGFFVTHKGTLLALGYIQASKQQRKFFVCPPDMSYAIISESNNHLFIYRQNKPVASGKLRNRMTGEKIGFIAEQQVINLTSSLSAESGEIVGIYASDKNVFLLTENYIMAMQL